MQKRTNKSVSTSALRKLQLSQDLSRKKC